MLRVLERLVEKRGYNTRSTHDNLFMNSGSQSHRLPGFFTLHARDSVLNNISPLRLTPHLRERLAAWQFRI